MGCLVMSRLLSIWERLEPGKTMVWTLHGKHHSGMWARLICTESLAS